MASTDRLIEVFDEARNRAAGPERDGYLDPICAGDSELRWQVCSLLQAAPVTTAYSYQGRLIRNNGPANGTCDLLFELYAAPTGGNRIGQQLEVLSQQISGGLFTVELNFGGPMVFDGTAYWLAIFARPSNGATYTPTPGRVAIRPTPYAIHALSAASVQNGWITTSSLADGAITANKLAPSAITQTQLNTVAMPAAGQVLAFNGTGLSWITPLGGAGVSSPWLLNGTDAYYNGGNVGIGTPSPASKLEVKGALTLNDNGDPAIFTGTGGTELNRYLGILNSPNYQSASGLRAGGVLVSDDYYYANPGKTDLIVKGKVGIGLPDPVAPLEITSSWDATQTGHIRLSGSKPTVEWRTSVFDGIQLSRHTWLAHVGPSNGLEFWYRKQNLPGTDLGWHNTATFLLNGNLTVAGSIDYAGGDSYGGDITATRLILRADPAFPANAAVLCHDAAAMSP